jgi:hypothetical protein
VTITFKIKVNPTTVILNTAPMYQPSRLPEPWDPSIEWRGDIWKSLSRSSDRSLSLLLYAWAGGSGIFETPASQGLPVVSKYTIRYAHPTNLPQFNYISLANIEKRIERGCRREKPTVVRHRPEWSLLDRRYQAIRNTCCTCF